jgi:predicted anti-sigma-YlaC factor YlaD
MSPRDDGGRARPDCERFRVALSARLDGEPLGLSAAALDDHVAGCDACARWAEQVARIGRPLRVRTEQIPDFSDRIMAEVALPERSWRPQLLIVRTLLVIAALTQMAVGLTDLLGDSMGMAMGEHAAHESAAWNIALGAGFLLTAVRPRLAGGLLTVLIAFTAVLLATSWYDYATGAVELSRLLTHAAVVAGCALSLTLRLRWAPPPDLDYAVGDEEIGQTGRRLFGAA